MSGLAVAVIEGEESRIRETFRGEGEKRKGETKEQKPQSGGLWSPMWTAGQKAAKRWGHQNRETLGF